MLVLGLEIKISILAINQELYPNTELYDETLPGNGERFETVTVVIECTQALIEIKDVLTSGKFISLLYEYLTREMDSFRNVCNSDPPDNLLLLFQNHS